MPARVCALWVLYCCVHFVLALDERGSLAGYCANALLCVTGGGVLAAVCGASDVWCTGLSCCSLAVWAWRCWFIGAFDRAVVFVVLGDAGPSLLSPCKTHIHVSHALRHLVRCMDTSVLCIEDVVLHVHRPLSNAVTRSLSERSLPRLPGPGFQSGLTACTTRRCHVQRARAHGGKKLIMGIRQHGDRTETIGSFPGQCGTR